MISAPQYCCDEELFRLEGALEESDIGVVVASTTTAEAMGERLGIKINPDFTIHEIDINDFDGVIIGSGKGCKDFLWQDERLREVVRLAFAQDKLIAASCNAPVVLARAGILKGKQATVYPAPESIIEFEHAGVIYKDEPVIVSGKIVTGRDLMALETFAEAIVEGLARQVTETK